MEYVAIALIVLVLCGVITDLYERREAKRIPHEVMRLRIQAGVEVFTREALDNGVPYRIIVQGKNATRHHTSGGLSFVNMDAVYIIDDRQYPRHEGLLFDGEPAVVCAEDRVTHSYTFAYVGTGRHLSVLLRLPEYHQSSTYVERPLKVIIRTLTPAEEIEGKAVEEERQRESAEMQHKELSRQAQELATLAYTENNFLDETYRQKYATKHTHEILTTFHRQWRDAYLALISNEPLYALVQEEHPLVLEIFAARFQVLQIAQRLAVEPPPAHESQSRLTPEEWAARIERYRQRSLSRKRVKFEDHRADVLQDLEMLQDFIADLDRYPLDEDERERLITEFKERLLGGDEESNNGFKQL
ncbi:MAG TPA: hypothetical protein VLQ80_10375 [Candidatus Saccharimonadia bacterium]|nr:hypothetical protein [Candidatus Saccharimonadia bacterium]